MGLFYYAGNIVLDFGISGILFWFSGILFWFLGILFWFLGISFWFLGISTKSTSPIKPACKAYFVLLRMLFANERSYIRMSCHDSCCLGFIPPQTAANLYSLGGLSSIRNGFF